ncbi:MAG: 3-deoxy-7-phosphoheptulonate synthase [Patiriisocius sp.]|jgi:3-deoxy-7-phosphoheptulonate synthase
MIIHLKKEITSAEAAHLAIELKAIHVIKPGQEILVTGSAVKELDSKYHDKVEEFFPMNTDIQLSSKDYRSETREVKVGKVTIGGNTNNTLVIAGPCSVENEAQITESATYLNGLGIHALRAGCFKPRTSPYSFQGLGREGLELLAKMREKFGMSIVTEVRDATHIEDVIEFTDVIQIGAKSMYDHGILRRCGKSNKPVLLKRGFGTTLQEFVQASEFILSGGNENVILCERGIRTFETKTRFTFDLCGVSFLKEHTNLPIILDPSHAMGYAYGVPDLARASVAMGVDGVLIEVHPTPKKAWSDASQQLNHEEFSNLHGSLSKVAQAVGKKII